MSRRRKQTVVPDKFAQHPLYRLCREPVLEFARAGVSVDLDRIDNKEEPSLSVMENSVIFFGVPRERTFKIDAAWGAEALARKEEGVSKEGDEFYVTFCWTEVRGKIANDPFHTRVFPGTFRYNPTLGKVVKCLVGRNHYKWFRPDGGGQAKRFRDTHAVPPEALQGAPEIYPGAPKEDVPDLVKMAFYPFLPKDETEEDVIVGSFYKGKVVINASADFDSANYGVPVFVRVIEEMRTTLVVMEFTEDEQAAVQENSTQALQTTIRELEEHEFVYGTDILNMWIVLGSYGVAPKTKHKEAKSAQRTFAKKMHGDKDAALLRDFENRKEEPPKFLKDALAKKQDAFKRVQIAFNMLFERFAKQKAEQEDSKAAQKEEAVDNSAEPAAASEAPATAPAQEAAPT